MMSSSSQGTATQLASPLVATVFSTKGGVGKTTIAANLGAFCADAGLRVLLLDLDIQPSLSSFYQMTDQAVGGSTELLGMNVCDPDRIISHTSIQNLSVITSNDPMGQLTNLLLNASDGRLRLRHLIHQMGLGAGFDLILIDTQGARSVIQEMALLASDMAISPVTSDMMSAREFNRGVLQMMVELQTFCQYMSFGVPQVQLVVNNLSADKDAKAVHDTLRAVFADHPGVHLVETALPAAVAFRRAASEATPVHRLEPVRPSSRKSPAAFDLIQDLAVELFPQWSERLLAFTPKVIAEHQGVQ